MSNKNIFDKEDLIINSIKYYNNKYDVKYVKVEDLKVRIDSIKDELKYYSDMYDFESGDLNDLNVLINDLKSDLRDIRNKRISKIAKDIDLNMERIIVSSVANKKIAVMLNNNYMVDNFSNKIKLYIEELNNEFPAVPTIFTYDYKNKVIKLEDVNESGEIFLFSVEDYDNLRGLSFNDFFISSKVFEFRGKGIYNKKEEDYIISLANLTLYDSKNGVKILRIY